MQIAHSRLGISCSAYEGSHRPDLWKAGKRSFTGKGPLAFDGKCWKEKDFGDLPLKK